MIKAILFDWHGVLDKVKLGGLFELISRDTGISTTTLKEKLINGAIEASLGNITDEKFFETIREEVNVSPDIAAKWESYLNSIEFNEHLWNMLPDLHKKYKLGILSDCPTRKAMIIRKAIDANLFDGLFFSAEARMDKSMSQFFNMAVDKLGIKNEETLFVDDSEKNIDFAITLGFQVCKFSSTEDLLVSLNKHK